MKKILDLTDERILELMQDNARITIKEIASRVYLSSPAVIARIERMESRGVLGGYHAQINTNYLGYGIKAFVTLLLNEDRQQDFVSSIGQEKNVMECDDLENGSEIMMTAKFRSEEELALFKDRMSAFGSVKTRIVRNSLVEHRGVPVLRAI